MLTAFLLPLKQQPNDPVVRFETQPGEQMQVDFTVIRQGRNPLLAFVATLGWSRATFVRFYPRQDTAAWCDGIEQALLAFGGTPRHLLFDNAKTIILERDVYGDGRHRWNPPLLTLAGSTVLRPGCAGLIAQRPRVKLSDSIVILSIALSSLWTPRLNRLDCCLMSTQPTVASGRA